MDTNEQMIRVQNLTKSFRIPVEASDGLKQKLINILKGRKGYRDFTPLNNVSFEVNKGDFFGIVGRNGSGKSTLLKTIAGIYTPNEGAVHVNGTLVPFIELGVGFNPELSGRENVFLNGALLGFSHEEMESMYDSIVDFAEIHEFMDERLKNYSSGMQVRLAFSIAIKAKGDILLLDEVLAVGDAAFQAKCFEYFNQLKKTNATVIFISHDKASLERFCNRGVLIDEGKVIESGKISKVLDAYSKVVLKEISDSDGSKKDEDREQVDKNGYVRIKNTTFRDKSNRMRQTFSFGESICAEFSVEVKTRITNPIFGITLWQNHLDRPVFATNTLIEGKKETGEYEKGVLIDVSISIPYGLNDGEYYIEPAVANEAGVVFYDRKPKAAKMIINGSKNAYSLISNKDKIILNIQKKGR